MYNAELPVAKFLMRAVQQAKSSANAGIIVIAARAADAGGVLADALLRQWEDLHDVTGGYLAMLGPDASRRGTALARSAGEHQPWLRSIGGRAVFEPTHQALAGDLSDEFLSRYASVRGERPTGYRREDLSRVAAQTRDALGLSEEHIPCVVLLSLWEQRAYVVPISDEFDLYLWVKRLVERMSPAAQRAEAFLREYEAYRWCHPGSGPAQQLSQALKAVAVERKASHARLERKLRNSSSDWRKSISSLRRKLVRLSEGDISRETAASELFDALTRAREHPGAALVRLEMLLASLSSPAHGEFESRLMADTHALAHQLKSVIESGFDRERTLAELSRRELEAAAEAEARAEASELAAAQEWSEAQAEQRRRLDDRQRALMEARSHTRLSDDVVRVTPARWLREAPAGSPSSGQVRVLGWPTTVLSPGEPLRVEVVRRR